MIYLYLSILHFERVLFSRDSAYAEFRENKTLEKISKFTVIGDSTQDSGTKIKPPINTHAGVLQLGLDWSKLRSGSSLTSFIFAFEHQRLWRDCKDV